MSVNSKMTAIADAIRDKTGNTDLLGLDDMAENVPKVYDAGVQSEYDRFWDNYQQNGNRRNYWGAFSLWFWTDEVFNPKYPLNVSDNGTYIFYSNSVITHIPEITFTASQLAYVCQGASRLEIIDKITLKNDGTQQIYSPFEGCSALREIRWGGVIGDNLSFKDSPLLSAESLASTVEHLSTTSSGKTLTVSQTAVNNADWSTTDYADWAALIATKTNWTFSLV